MVAVRSSIRVRRYRGTPEGSDALRGRPGRLETAVGFFDQPHEAWEIQMAALRRLGPTGRVAVAVDLSESVRALQVAGIEAVHPEWSRAAVVRHLVRTQYGIELPRGQ
jgi:hypothetical protein